MVELPIYTGAGNRNAPSYVIETFEIIGRALANQGWTLRSGGSSGCDVAFEKGCRQSPNKYNRTIFLPWSHFNNHDNEEATYLDSKYFRNTEAYRIAKKYHPSWRSLNEDGEKLMTRNVYMLLGRYCNRPSDLLICYNNQGDCGGTTQAIRIAKAFKIPILNFAEQRFKGGNQLFLDYVKEYIRKFKPIIDQYNAENNENL